MARIRSIKPEVWSDPDVVACSPLARLLWIGTWNHADDYGVLKDDPGRLKLQILPADDVDPHALVGELVDRQLLLRKVAPDGTRVLVIRTFCVHQKIDRRATGRWGIPDDFTDPPDPPTRRPAPPVRDESPPIPTDPPDSQPDPTTPHHTNGRERIGREGKTIARPAEVGPTLALVPAPASSPPATVSVPPPPPARAGPPPAPRAPVPGRYPPDFLAWWELYPKHVAKAAAAKAWRKARSLASWDELLNGLKAWLPTWEHTDPQYIPYPARWLNERRWENHPAPEPDRRLAAEPKGYAGIRAALEASP